MTSYREHGFTLLELVVVVALLAVVSTLGYTSLRYLQASSASAEQHLGRLRDLQIAMGVFEQDLRNVAARPVSVGLATRQGAVSGTDVQLELTRGGVIRMDEDGLSGLMRVGYSFRDGQLRRHVWRVLDQPSDTKAGETRALVDNLSSVSFRYIGADGAWVEQWRGVADTDTPRAVELKFRSERLGNLRRLVVLN